MISCATPNFNAHVLGVIVDLHLPKDWVMGVEPFRELRNSQLP